MNLYAELIRCSCLLPASSAVFEMRSSDKAKSSASSGAKGRSEPESEPEAYSLPTRSKSMPTSTLKAKGAGRSKSKLATTLATTSKQMATPLAPVPDLSDEEEEQAISS